MESSILFVDDEICIRKAFRMMLENDYRIFTAERGGEALDIFDREKLDLILLDIGLPDMSGIDVLQIMKKSNAEIPIVMVTAIDEVKTIVRAIKLGAYDYLVKPLKKQDIRLTIQHALENKILKDRIRAIQKPFVDGYKYEMIGISPSIKKLIVIIKKISESVDTPILIVGESGTGKSILAQCIHYNNHPDPGPFIVVNCGAISPELVESELFGYERGAFTGARHEGKKGYFELAAGGTLFLDEIGAMPLSAQSKLLNVLENRKYYKVGGIKEIPVHARIVAATNIELEKAVSQGNFRKDLYYRLNVVKLEMPPLRKRPEDILLLTTYFLEKYNQKLSKTMTKIMPEAERMLQKYPWPGNIRELKNTIERVVLLGNGNVITPAHLSFLPFYHPTDKSAFTVDLSRGEAVFDDVVKTLIEETLKKTGGNVVEAAKLLKMPAHKLRYRIQKYAIKTK